MDHHTVACATHVVSSCPFQLPHVLALENFSNERLWWSRSQQVGVYTGEPLATILYGLGVLPIVMAFKHYVGETDHRRSWSTLQLWYANYSFLNFSISRIKVWFTKLLQISRSIRYHPNSDNILIVASESNSDLATYFFSESESKIKKVFFT